MRFWFDRCSLFPYIWRFMGSIVAEATLQPQRDENGRFLPGTVGNPGGRPKGALRQLREAIQEAYPEGLDPAVELLKIAELAKEKDQLDVARKCYSDVADRIYPRLKQVEHNGDQQTSGPTFLVIQQRDGSDLIIDADDPNDPDAAKLIGGTPAAFDDPRRSLIS